MNWFRTVKRYFDLGIYTVENVRLFVEAGRITKEQFKEITGEDFDPVTQPTPEKHEDTKVNVIEENKVQPEKQN